MTPRERELATIRHEHTDRISTDVICVENQEEIAAYLGIEQNGVYDRLGIDGRIVVAGYRGGLPTGLAEGVIDEWGVVEYVDYGTSHIWPLAKVTCVTDIEAYPWPDPARYDYLAAAKAAHAMAGEYAVRGPYWMPLFCRVCNLFGMEEAMMRMAVEPAIFNAALDRVFEITDEYCRRLFEACGDDLPIFCLGDDFATQRGLMISPESWRAFLKPRFARLFERAKRAGKFVWFHSCGDITAILPDLVDIGLDVWETVQLHTVPMAPEHLKREFGKHITFFGGVNTQRLPFVTPAEVRSEVRRCIEVLGKDGGYICGPDHHIKTDVSAENVLALFDTAKEWQILRPSWVSPRNAIQGNAVRPGCSGQTGVGQGSRIY